MEARELFELIKSRRSVTPGQYTDEPIAQEELNLILESANWAPNHKRTEPWRFTVIEGAARERFAQFMEKIYLEDTPAEAQSERKRQAIIEKCIKSDKILLIGMKKSLLLPEWEELAATAMAVQNMWLMCTSLGIGSYWSSPSAIHRMQEFTAMEENEVCLGIFYMGKLKGNLLEGSRKPMEPKVQFIKD